MSPQRVLGILLVLSSLPWCTTRADEPKAPPPKAARCEEAVVNPVSGYAECVKPPGAPVDPPPPRPLPSAEVCARHPELGADACEPAKPPATSRPGS
jgi:hypothetical protein